MEKHGMGAEPTNVVELPIVRGPGERLRAARNVAGLTLQSVAEELHLSPKRLEALERDDYSQMPDRVFVRGYLRNYARLMDLPADGVLAAFDAHAPAEQEAGSGLRTVVSAPQIRSQLRSSHSAVRAVTWIIVLALAALLLTWWQGYLEWPSGTPLTGDAPGGAPIVVLPMEDAIPQPVQREAVAFPPEPKPNAAAVDERSAAVSAGAHGPAAAPADPVAAEPAVTPSPAVVLELTGRSWLEVVDSTGVFKLNGTFEKGYRTTFGGEPPYRIAIGNLNAARLLVGGKPVDLLPHFNGRLARLTLDPRGATQ